MHVLSALDVLLIRSVSSLPDGSRNHTDVLYVLSLDLIRLVCVCSLRPYKCAHEENRWCREGAGGQERRNVPNTDPLPQHGLMEGEQEEARVLRRWIADLPNPRARPARRTLEIMTGRNGARAQQTKDNRAP
ncbi:uncharacterized protein UTRI_05477 [Ustilago trichophora]|uniref:Uncharacterized protein n=1 Tax=Ustilago trichophora TaxID=86804 RepID=A0A5C3EHV9_9BASI|nr:uncharacterized protein UTRI_05477 [Ustilago trichophora]